MKTGIISLLLIQGLTLSADGLRLTLTAPSVVERGTLLELTCVVMDARNVADDVQFTSAALNTTIFHQRDGCHYVNGIEYQHVCSVGTHDISSVNKTYRLMINEMEFKYVGTWRCLLTKLSTRSNACKVKIRDYLLHLKAGPSLESPGKYKLTCAVTYAINMKDKVDFVAGTAARASVTQRYGDCDSDGSSSCDSHTDVNWSPVKTYSLTTVINDVEFWYCRIHPGGVESNKLKLSPTDKRNTDRMPTKKDKGTTNSLPTKKATRTTYMYTAKRDKSTTDSVTTNRAMRTTDRIITFTERFTMKTDKGTTDRLPTKKATRTTYMYTAKRDKSTTNSVTTSRALPKNCCNKGCAMRTTDRIITFTERFTMKTDKGTTDILPTKKENKYDVKFTHDGVKITPKTFPTDGDNRSGHPFWPAVVTLAVVDSVLIVIMLVYMSINKRKILGKSTTQIVEENAVESLSGMENPLCDIEDISLSNTE